MDFLSSLDNSFKVSEFKNTISITKWDLEYEKALSLQKSCQEFVRREKDKRVFISTNHPHCFTYGRGVRAEELVPFDEKVRLNFPIYKIKRGGGLTFHYNGQWIIYPIVNLNKQEFNLSRISIWLLTVVSENIRKCFGINVSGRLKPHMGIWYKDKKVGSIGIGIEHFVTHHGLALNVLQDETIFNALKLLHPCGLPSEIYTSLQGLRNENFETNSIDKFNDLFIESLRTII